jgi:hypothetical protein
MGYLLENLQNIITESFEQLKNIPDKESEKPISPGKWSRKEIIGHLIDSASNNHQRFVRIQLVSNFSFPGYEQEKWVKLQNYQVEPWIELIELWKNYNLHLLHVVSAIPEEIMKRTCKIGDKQPVSLFFLFNDYINHMKHHLGQVLGQNLLS